MNIIETVQTAQTFLPILDIVSSVDNATEKGTKIIQAIASGIAVLLVAFGGLQYKFFQEGQQKAKKTWIGTGIGYGVIMLAVEIVGYLKETFGG